MTNKEMIRLDYIRWTSENQARAGMDRDTLDEYTAAMKDDAQAGTLDRWPALEVVKDKHTGELWGWDGHHRSAAARAAGIKYFPCMVEVAENAKARARWLSASANATHGLRRTNDDKRKAVTMALEIHPEMSDRAIAKHCGVGNKFVGDMRRQACSEHTCDEPQTRVGQDGKTYPARGQSGTLITIDDPQPEEETAAPDTLPGAFDRGRQDFENGLHVDQSPFDNQLGKRQLHDQWLEGYRHARNEAIGEEPTPAPKEEPPPESPKAAPARERHSLASDDPAQVKCDCGHMASTHDVDGKCHAMFCQCDYFDAHRDNESVELLTLPDWEDRLPLYDHLPRLPESPSKMTEETYLEMCFVLQALVEKVFHSQDALKWVKSKDQWERAYRTASDLGRSLSCAGDVVRDIQQRVS